MKASWTSLPRAKTTSEDRRGVLRKLGGIHACRRSTAKVGLAMPDLRSFAPADRDIPSVGVLTVEIE
ncbi:MAG: hypothetical protein AAGA21_07740 [Pseudomonadota bacterium]